MTSPFLTLSETAAYLRYDLDGPDGAKNKASLVKWLAKYGIRPSLKRGLYRLVQIEAAVERIEAEQTQRRRKGYTATVNNLSRRPQQEAH